MGSGLDTGGFNEEVALPEQYIPGLWTNVGQPYFCSIAFQAYGSAI